MLVINKKKIFIFLISNLIQKKFFFLNFRCNFNVSFYFPLIFFFFLTKENKISFQKDKSFFEKEIVFPLDSQVKFHTVTKSVIDKEDISSIFEKINADPLEVLDNISLEKNFFFHNMILSFRLKLIRKSIDNGEYQTAKLNLEEIIGLNNENDVQLPIEIIYLSWFFFLFIFSNFSFKM